jgi:hypothetical protein
MMTEEWRVRPALLQERGNEAGQLLVNQLNKGCWRDLNSTPRLTERGTWSYGIPESHYCYDLGDDLGLITCETSILLLVLCFGE